MKSAHALLERVMDFVLPPLCLRCDTPVTQNQTLCADCWKTIHFVAAPFCSCCGAPFDLPIEGEMLCGACLETPPAFASARSVFLYDDESKPIILRLKHADQLHGLPLLAQWLAKAGEPFWPQVDMIVPVPLHRWRLLSRRYNQSALLAVALGKRVGKTVRVDALLRTRATPKQGHLSKKQRAENVARAFAVRQGAAVAGKNIVLVDDVLTSGATLSECARVLIKAGAARVDVVTLARVRVAS